MPAWQFTVLSWRCSLAATVLGLYGLGMAAAAADIVLVSQVPGSEDATVEGDPNQAIVEFSPASTFKMILALCAFEKGIATPETTMTCSDAHLPKRPMKVDFQQAMYHSSNQYFYPLIDQLTDEEIVAMAEKCGFGKVKGPMPKNRKDWRFGGPIRITPRAAHVFMRALALGKLPVSPKAQGNLIRVMSWESPDDKVKTFGKTGSWEQTYWFNGLAATDRSRRVITIVLTSQGAERKKAILTFYQKAVQQAGDLGLD